LLGARYRVGDFVVGAALGPGLTTAPGVSPRVVLSVAWEPAKPQPVTPSSSEHEPTPAPIAHAPTAPGPDAAPRVSRASTAPPVAPAAPSTPPSPSPTQATAPAPALSEADAKEQARRLFRDGVEAYDAARYAEAVKDFRRAYELKPHPTVLRNLAHSELMNGELAHACRHFMEWKKEEPDPRPADAAQANEGIKRACR
jgi:Flp pilus assembly protein TadD